MIAPIAFGMIISYRESVILPEESAHWATTHSVCAQRTCKGFGPSPWSQTLAPGAEPWRRFSLLTRRLYESMLIDMSIYSVA
jgi:hypothetical protein